MLMKRNEFTIPSTYEKKISTEIAKEIISDNSVNVDDFEWYVAGKNVELMGLADVIEEHDMYWLIGYSLASQLK